MKKKLILIITALLSINLLFAGCTQNNKDEDISDNEGTGKYGLTTVDNLSSYDYSKFKDKKITLNVANWGEYISANEEDVLDVNKAFEKLTGIKINYKTYETNESLYSKLKGSGAEYDVIIPSDYMISKMIDENMLSKLNFDDIPNYNNIDDKFKKSEYDKTNEYSVPYMWGIVAIVYNTTMVDKPVNSWDILWDDKYKNNILMINNPRDAFAIALKKAGYSLNSENKKEIDEAYRLLVEQKPIVQGYVMDEIFDKMESDSSAIGVYYGGDIITMMDNNQDLAYAIPKEGTNRFVDAMCIPTTAKNKLAAQMYINFMCETNVGLANCEYTGYSTPLKTTYDELDQEIKDNPLAYPDDKYIIENTETFINLSPETNQYNQELWSQLKVEDSKSQWLMTILLFGGLTSIAVITGIFRKKKNSEDIY